MRAPWKRPSRSSRCQGNFNGVTAIVAHTDATKTPDADGSNDNLDGTPIPDAPPSARTSNRSGMKHAR